ncbi:MAG: glycosyltransferase family 4 protein [Bryobacteraceae bacterium]|nr:glycosyltransferase family 4 protein [Bryobacteraceae bacterium]
MKIAYVITRGDSVGGASIHVRDMSSGMLARGHDVIVFLGGCGPVTDALAERGVPYQALPNLGKPVDLRRDAAAYLELRKAFRRFEPDLVSAHTAKAGFLGRAAAHALGVPAVFTPHGWAITDRISRNQGRVFTLAERIAAPWAKAIVNVCEFERRLALSKGVGRPEQHVVIYNGVHDSPLRAKPGLADRTLRIVSIARFEAPKDHVTLLHALSSLRDLSWELDLIGDGPDEHAVLELAKTLHLCRRIVFHGYVRDPASLLQAAHLFVLSSRSEGFPRSVLEAMRAGLPVVASDVGGISEALGREAGVVVPSRDSPALTDAIRDFLLNPERRQRMGDAGHLIFGERFRFERTLLETEALYTRVA